MLSIQRVMLGVLVGVMLFPTTSHAQKKLTYETLTAQQIIEKLKPKIPNRGVAPDGATCAVFRQTEGQMRGVGMTEKPAVESERVPDIVALRVTFAFNSAEISPRAKPVLKVMAEALHSKELQGSCIQIEGHTDSKGTDEYNLKLSQRRAESIVAYLANQLKVGKKYLIPVGKGETEPIANNETDEGREQNRRVQLVNRGYATEAKTQSSDEQGWKEK